jgi:hypothetical protein
MNMKIYIFTLSVILAFAISVFGQVVAKPTPEKEQSKIEAFSARSGSLMQRQFIKLGDLQGGVNIQIYRLTDLLSKTTISGVRFEYEVKSSYSTDTKIAVLDADEVDGLIKSIEALQTTIFPTTPDTYTEITYRSRGGFEAGAYFADAKWKTYLKLEKYDSKSIVFMRIEDLTELLAILKQAKVKLV